MGRGRWRHPDDDPPRLPLDLGAASNDEYDPVPPSPVVREAERRALDHVLWAAPRVGLSRRAFLRSAIGATTSVFFLNACTREAARHAPSPSPGSPTTEPGGSFTISPEATVDPDAAASELANPDFVMDVQHHFLDYDLTQPIPASWFGSGFPQRDCGQEDPRACFAVDHYLEEVFVESDTTVAVLSAVPIRPGPDHPFSADVMERARQLVDQYCGPGRLLMQGQANPDIGALDDRLADMEALAAAHDLAAWKVYTHSPGPGWRFDDADPALAPVGGAFLAKVRDLGVPIVAVHKGFSGRDPLSSPADIGPAAAANPDLSFVVYHSGYEPSITEGPYDPDGGGIDRLIRSLEDAGIGPGGNVYAELGSTWFNVVRDPTEAAHTLGKLLAHLGSDNIVWGTDSIWYGSPQGQLAAFRTFEISEEFQERFDYPALTDDIKRRILGLTSARLYGVDTSSIRCQISRDDLEELRRSAPRPS